MPGKKRYSIAVLSILLVAVSVLIAQQTNTRAHSPGLGLVVVDSTGKTLGPVIGVTAYGATTVAFPFHGKPLPLGVQRSSFDQANLYFVTDDCSGEPFESTGGPFLTTVVFGTNNTLFVENGPVQSITVLSQLVPPPYGTGCSPQTPFTLSAVPLKRVVDLNQIFTPPFSVVTPD